MHTTYDVIVAGCGGFGSAAMCHLARRGLRVLGIDQFAPPHDRGSSHGETRVIRKAYFEHPNYVPLLKRAYVLWDELAERTVAAAGSSAPADLFVRCGLLLAGQSDGEVIAGARDAAARHQLSLESLTATEVRQRFPQFAVPASLATVFEPDAGFLYAERCVAAHLSDAARNGAQLLTDTSVRSIRTETNSATVCTDRQTFSASAVVVTSGAWAGSLLAANLPEIGPLYDGWIRVRRKTLFWHPITDPIWNDLSRTPIHLLQAADDQPVFYGFPGIDGQTVKLAEHTGGDPVDDPTHVDRQVTTADGHAVSGHVRQFLNGVSPVAARSAVCMYSMTPDSHFLIDRLPEAPIVVAAGFSGHGFKFTSVIGEAIADLVEHGQTALPIDFLSARRLLSSV